VLADDAPLAVVALDADVVEIGRPVTVEREFAFVVTITGSGSRASVRACGGSAEKLPEVASFPGAAAVPAPGFAPEPDIASGPPSRRMPSPEPATRRSVGTDDSPSAGASTRSWQR